LKKSEYGYSGETTESGKKIPEKDANNKEPGRKIAPQDPGASTKDTQKLEEKGSREGKNSKVRAGGVS